ncbi:hypothetical protein PC118_g11914 [Phytophthora cactorum]|uniref:Uncharacterized protein n=1 Tax=Phytophthora cactorum TaxID=29920 RepID=A0A8T1FPL1_9STRA|nr:hypothetical protein PC118_g11914 [Phytophthora cactorum]
MELHQTLLRQLRALAKRDISPNYKAPRLPLCLVMLEVSPRGLPLKGVYYVARKPCDSGVDYVVTDVSDIM